MSVTMKDVAARAGVSPTVVSRVLHNKATSIRVSEPTAERVRKAAKDMGYRVNVMARNFRERQTQMIGVLHGIGFERLRFDRGTRYFAALMDGIVDGAFDHGYSVTLCPRLLGQSPEDAMSDGRFDGLIWYSTFPMGENRTMLENCSVPLVLIHTSGAEFGGKFPSVMCDNAQGASSAVDHLVGLGHKKIAFAFDGDDPFGETKMRSDAFESRLIYHGLSVDQKDMIDVRGDRSGLVEYYSGGLLHTGIVCSNDGVAADFILHSPDFSIRIPDDLSVVGFDSTSFCNELRPSLTSVSQPLVVMGRTAVDLLIKNINGDLPDTPNVVYPCGLDVRGSTTSIVGR